VAQVIRIPSALACVFRTARRCRTTRGASRSSPVVVGAVEHAAQVSGAELVERERHRPDADGDLLPVHGERVRHLGRRVQQHVDDRGQAGLALGSPVKDVEGFLAGALLLRCQRPLKRRGGDRVEQAELPFPSAARGERVQPHPPTGRECDRLDVEHVGETFVLALDVDDPRLPAEDGLPEDVGLDEARLRPADDPDHDGVRAGQLPAVQLPRVVAE
jgi:hypothetical protein